MDTNFNTDQLTSGEISQLWGTYMGDSSQLCVLSHFLNVIEDEEIKKVVEIAYAASERHVQKIAAIFKSEGHEVPEGFSVDTDVESNATRLFTDHYMLEYLYQFSRIGLRAHGLNLSFMVRGRCNRVL